MPGRIKQDPYLTKVKGSRTYRYVHMAPHWSQYQVITAIGFHWRHIALVDVKDGQVGKAERYFYSIEAPEVILPIEVVGKDFLATVCKKRREFIKSHKEGPVQVEGSDFEIST